MGDSNSVLLAHNPSATFHMNLHVDQAVSDRDPEMKAESIRRKCDDTYPSRRSWKLQLLGLVHQAPRPLPVICNEPRRFPHFGTTNRISESSWTSDSTCSTKVSESDSTSLTLLVEGTGEKLEKIPPSQPSSSSIFHPGFDASKKSNNAEPSLPLKEKSENVATCANTKMDNKTEVKEPFTLSQKHLNSPTSPKPQIPQGHQVQGKAENKARNVSTSLSIHGDSEYWEKFRYSKDYQSSLMIETICNEVFNLNPSPRYKSLMKLSQKKKNKTSKEETKESPHLLLTEGSNDKDEKGINAIMTEKEKVEKTKETASEQQSHHGESNEKREVCNASNTFPPKTNDDEDTGGKLEHSGQDEEVLDQDYERKQSVFSTTSSVFTVTTDDENGKESRMDGGMDRVLMAEGFGSTFHGYLTKRETQNLLRNEGQYLIRQVWKEDGFILSFRFDEKVRNYRITCELSGPIKRNSCGDDCHSTGNNCKYHYYLENRKKCYSTLDELVQEGLFTLHLDENAGSYFDLLVELAQSQQNDNLLQTPQSGPNSRKTSRSASFRTARNRSMIGSDSVSGSNKSSIATQRNSMEIPLLIHYFEEEIVDGLANCQSCSHRLWGPTNKGLRCRDCGLVVHESCIGNVKNECKPDLRTIPPFSTDLTTLVKGMYSTDGSYGAPYILQKCINEVETRGVETEGIYRVSGSVDEIENLKNLFERDKIHTDLSQCEDIHSITGLVKFFLRQLPDPVITQEVFEEFVRSDKCEMKVEEIQVLLRCLPPAHRITLRFFLSHLNRVAKEKAENKMNAFNLSSVLVPSMIGPANMSFNVIECVSKLLYFLITHSEELVY